MELLKRCGKVAEGAEASQEEKEQYFEERTARHIALVQAAANKIVKNGDPSKGGAEWKDFDENALLAQVAKHDQSKLEEPERTPYVAITWRHKVENEKDPKKGYDPISGSGYQTPGQLSKEDENKATLHHVTSNSHHPESHVKDKEDANKSQEVTDGKSKTIDATSMPNTDIAEMVADWQAMSEELKKNTAREWFNKQKDVRWHFSKEQENLIDRLLKVFETKEGAE